MEYLAPEAVSGKIGPVDFGCDVKQWEPVGGENVLVTTEDVFADAKIEEMRNWRQNGVFSTVPDKGQPVITTRWVLTEKDDG